MKAKEINIEQIDNLNDFYILLENNALYLESSHDITDLLLKYKSKTIIEDEKQKLQWEVEAFLFSFHGNTIFHFSTSNGKEIGEVVEYPKLDEHQTLAFEYITQRAELSRSALLKARYNHLLWKGIVKRHQFFAINASNNYIKAINQCYDLTKDNTFDYSLLITRLFENLIGIVNEARVNIEETKHIASLLLHSANGICFWSKHGILEDMLKYPNIFKANDFKKTLSFFDEHLKNVEGKLDDFALVNFHLPTAIKIAQKQKRDVKKWYNAIGYGYLRMAEGEKEDSRNWIKLDEYRAAIDAFRRSGNYAKKEETEQLYFQLKPKVKLDEFRIDYDEATVKKLQAFQFKLKEQAVFLLKEQPEVIYSIIGKGNFFLKYDAVLNASKQKENHFSDFFTNIYFDNNKNVSRKSTEKNEKHEILKTYGLWVKETLTPFLHYVIVFGIKSGHLTYKNLIQFLIKNTWIGKPHIKTDLSGNPEITNWINQIAPSIVEFFNQVLAWGESNYYTPNFILCIDSLTLKVEGLFRNFSERLNISTSKGKTKGMQEALTHDIINNEVIKQFFNRDDMLLFDYVFSNEGGLNLRNNIAHSFYSENEYHSDKMLLLLAVVLRLGKYNISSKSKQSAHSNYS